MTPTVTFIGDHWRPQRRDHVIAILGGVLGATLIGGWRN